jgi:YVTN family beta-propeller protein
MGYARYVGRVGALAVALGVGAAVASTPGVAWAEPDAGSTSSTDSSASTSGGTSGSPSTGSAGSSGDTTSDTGDGAEDAVEAGDSTGGMQVDSSGGAITSTKAGSAGAKSADEDAEADVDADENGTDSVTKPTTATAEPTTAAPQPKPVGKSGTDWSPRPSTPQKPKRSLLTTTTAPSGGAEAKPSVQRGAPSDDQAVQPTRSAAVEAPVQGSAPSPAVMAGTAAPRAVQAVVSTPVAPASAAPASAVSRLVSTMLSGVGLAPSAPGDVPSAPMESPLLLAFLAGWRQKSQESLAGEPSTATWQPAQSTLMLAESDTAAGEPMMLAAAASNSAPTASPSFGSPDQATGAIAGAINGADADGNTLSYAVTGTPPANGSVMVNPTTGAFTYTPTQLARFAAHDMGSGPDFDSFNVAVSDGQVSTPVTIQVAVLPALIPSIGTTAQTRANPMGMAVTPTKTYVANQASNSVSVIDRANPTAAPTTINVVASPRAIAVSSDGTRAYVAGNGGVSVINTATNQRIATVATTAGDSYGIAVGPSVNGQHRVYVTNAANNTVRVINANTTTNTYTAGASVTVGTTPRGIAVSPDGNRVYVSNWGAKSVSVLNTSTATPTLVGSPITVGTNPFGVVVSSDGTRVYVSNNGSASVSVLNPTAATPLVTTIAVDPQPFGMAISPDGSIVYAANGRDTVSMINTKTNTVYSTLIIDSQPESQWHSVAVSPDGRQIYVSDMADRTVRVATIIRGNTAPLAGTPTMGAGNLANGAVTGTLNFRDTDGDPLTYSVQAQPSSGTVTFNNAAGTYTFTPTQPARDAAGQTQGPDYASFTVLASDGTLIAPVTVNNVPILPKQVGSQIPVAVTAIDAPPYPIAVAISGNRAYVYGGDVISVIDTTNKTVVETTALYNDPPAITPDGRKYVPNPGLYYNGTAPFDSVDVIDTATGTIIKNIQIPICYDCAYANPSGPRDVVLSPDGNRVYVSEDYFLETGIATTVVTMIDTATDSVLGYVPVAPLSDMEFAPDGTIYGASAEYPVVTVYNADMGAIGTVPLTSLGYYYWSPTTTLALSPDANRAYVVVYGYGVGFSNSVIDIDPASPTYNNEIAVITERNTAVSPDGSRRYVTQSDGMTVVVYDTATDTVIGSFITDTTPGASFQSIAVASDSTLYITDDGDNKVYVVTVGNPAQQM